MKAGRKPSAHGLTRWELQIPTPLAAEIELKILDPLLNQPRYGYRSKLVVALLERWNRGEIDIPIGG